MVFRLKMWGARDNGIPPRSIPAVLCGTRRKKVEKKLEEWRKAMEDRGLKINRNKTVYRSFNRDGNLDGNSDTNLQGENLERMNTFK